jgi:phosphonopyruvate decarboxylase
MIARELYKVADRPGNFYMQGSMGHAISIGLGLCGGDSRKVIVLDGDGAILMHMGSLSTVGYYRPRDLIHVVLDNEAYGTTGNQQTTSPTTNFATIAIACGYVSGVTCSTTNELKTALRDAFEKRGPSLIRVKVNQMEKRDVPRITQQYTPEQNAQRFTAFAIGPGESGC